MVAIWVKIFQTLITIKIHFIRLGHACGKYKPWNVTKRHIFVIVLMY